MVIPRVLGDHGPSMFAAYGQIIHAAIDIGLARGALGDGVVFFRDRARPWWEAQVDRAAEDEQLPRLAGELDTDVRAAEALLVRAATVLDEADASDADADLVAEARLSVAAAKALPDGLR